MFPVKSRVGLPGAKTRLGGNVSRHHLLSIPVEQLSSRLGSKPAPFLRRLKFATFSPDPGGLHVYISSRPDSSDR